MDSDPTRRALTLLSLLQTRREWSAADLSARLTVGPRTLRRDIDRLRRLGYAVQTRPGPGSTYQLIPGTAVPPLLFTADEVTAMVAALALLQGRTHGDAAATALAKLEQVLPTALRRRATATELATEVLEGAAPTVATRDIGVVADAIAEDGRIRFGYVDAEGRCSRRLIDPYRQALSDGSWALIGYDVDRDDWRTFRFDRVTDIERVPGVYRRREFPHVSIEDWFATDFGRVTRSRAE